MPSDHLLPIAQLAADAFTGGKYVDQFCQNYIGNSHYDWNTSRVILDGEKLIHHWGVWGYQMRVEIGPAQGGGDRRGGDACGLPQTGVDAPGRAIFF